MLKAVTHAMVLLAVFLATIWIMDFARGGHVHTPMTPQYDSTIQFTDGKGAGSGTIIRVYQDNDAWPGCVVDVLTAAHVAKNSPIENQGEKFILVAMDEYKDLAILRGKVPHPCTTLWVARVIPEGVEFMTPIWTVGYPMGYRAYSEGFAGECLLPGDENDWCMHSIASGFGGSGSGVWAGDKLIGIVQRGIGEAGPYVIGIAAWHIAEFLHEVYEKRNM